MASPLAQNDRHSAVLRDVLAGLDLPVRAGIRMMPTISTLVLIAANARVDRPKRFDTSRVIKADALKNYIEKDLEALALLRLAKVVSSETLEALARQLAAQHRPLERPLTATPARISSPKTDAKTMSGGPSCKQCTSKVGAIQHGRFGYYFKCQACDTNTSIKFTCQPGHSPRLRKDGLRFLRECAECGSSALYHQNAP